MTNVFQLPDHLIRQIAAGEVIAEPQSVIKEAIENSLDAGATDIQIDINQGGITSIIIADNGSGISKEDLEIITTRHCTSKIKTEEDLYKVLTLGFRGEFLASLLAAADLTIITKEKSNTIAYKASYSVGSRPQIEQTSRTDGTTLLVNNLFEKLPARRNFLPKPKTSTARIHELVRQFALAYSRVRFRLQSDGQEVFRSQPGDKLNAISMVLGSKTSKNLIHISGESEDKKWLLTGFISKPSEVRATRSSEYFFVNGRIIENHTIQQALEDGYSNFLAQRRFPIAVLYLTAPPEEYDANVHPTKKEIRIKSENKVYQFVSDLVYTSLTNLTIEQDSTTRTTKQVVQQTFSKQKYNPKTQNSEKHAANRTTRSPHVSGSPVQEHAMPESNQLNVDDFDREESISAKEEKHPLEDPLHLFYDRLDITHMGDNNFIHVVNKDEIMDLEPIYQVAKTIIIAYNKNFMNQLYFIDQHAIAERITLEKMLFSKKKITKQSLLEPIYLLLTPEEQTLLNDIYPIMKKFGYSITQQSGLEIRIETLPLYQNKKLSQDQLVFNFRQILAESLKNKQSFRQASDIEQDVLKSIACHNSIRAGDTLTIQEMRQLLSDMQKAKFPYVCCHGRPAIFKLPIHNLFKLFWRT